MRITRSEFIKSVACLSQIPEEDRPELIFAGRSNSGKSSTINKAIGSRSLAKTSKTPGRTQLINYYNTGDGEAYIVDLPGYGYAKDKRVADFWVKVVKQFLLTNNRRVLIVWILDIRRPLEDNDLFFLNTIAPKKFDIHIVLTKADKLNNSKRILSISNLEHAMSTIYADYYNTCSIQELSNLNGFGVMELRDHLEGYFDK